MPKLTTLFFLAAALAWAATTVEDTVRTPANEGLFSGQLTIEAPDIVYQGQFFARQLLRYNVRNGGVNNSPLSISLVPNIGAETEATRYRVEYLSRDGSRFNCVWIVPESVTPLKIWQVQRNCGPTLSTAVNPWQIAGAKENAGKALVSDGETFKPVAVMQDPTQLRGDLAVRGPGGVQRLQLGPAGTVLKSNGTDIVWEQPSSTGGSGSVQSYTANFTNQSTVTIPRASHGFATANLIATIYNTSGRVVLAPVTVDAGSFDVTVTFAAASSGRVVLTKSPSYSLSFTSAVTVTIPGSLHGLATQNLSAACFKTNGQQFGFGSLVVNPTTYDAVFTFAEATSGRCVLQGGNL